MSKKGIKRFANILTQMQLVRGELIGMGCKKIGTKEGNQDIRLGQMLEEMKEHIKKEFIKITLK